MVTAIIAAAGQGKRMGRGINKLFIPLFKYPVLSHTVKTVDKCRSVSQIVVVVANDDKQAVEKLLLEANVQTPYTVVIGGSERQLSITNALAAVSPQAKVIVVHDGARPLCATDEIERVIAAAIEYRAAGIGVRVKDTIKVVSEENFVVSTPKRNTLWAIQTPQAFATEIIRQAYRQAELDGYMGTDDASLVERIGIPVKLVEGSYSNIKITTPEDVIIAKALIRQDGDSSVRFGIGYDVHQLVTERALIIGGVTIPYQLGLAGHSDADVLLHAVSDALLGAVGLGDIGRHFPDTDDTFSGISSMILLAKVNQLINGKGYKVNNIDATIVAQKPKLSPYIEQMNSNIADCLQIPPELVNVKATTTEGLGFAGRAEGIAAYAVASVTEF